MSYITTAKALKDTRVDYEAFVEYPITAHTPEAAEHLEADIEETIWLDENAMDELRLWELDTDEYSVDWSEGYCDEDYRHEILAQLIKPANHYMVYASHIRWTGADGVLFADSLEKALHRDYDAELYVESASKNGKVLILTEYHHDCPQGATEVVIALTDKEYAHLSGSSWETIEAFASSKHELASA